MAKKKKKTGTKKKTSKAKAKVSKASSKKETTRKVSHAGARAKGLQFEREVANSLGHIFPEAKRHLEYQASEVDGSDISGIGPYKIQCKNYQNYAPIGKIREIRQAKNIVPVLATKGNKMKPVIVMYMDDWVKLLEMAHGTADMNLISENPKTQVMIEAGASDIPLSFDAELDFGKTLGRAATAEILNQIEEAKEDDVFCGVCDYIISAATGACEIGRAHV